MIKAFSLLVILFLTFFASSAIPLSQDGKEDAVRAIEGRQSSYAKIARQIWEFAEVGYMEEKSSSLLRSELKAAGFSVLSGVAEIPTAFVASYGEGKPVVCILAEFDALPGISQDAVAERKPIEGKSAGHACGHHLFGTASVAAAIAVKEWLERSKMAGTIRLYGTPAEEGGGGKIYMIKAGLFDDVDAVLAWHPSDKNDASPSRSLANISVKFRFHGVSAHASGAPEKGRSALDGVEAMNYMVNLMREHMPSNARIHYVITNGGKAPNVVPDFAEAYYYVRHLEVKVVDELFKRIIKAAEGAALGTETRVEHEVINGVHSVLPNEYIGKLLDENLRRVGGYKYTPEEQAFAEKIQRTLMDPEPIGSQESVMPWRPTLGGGSTDIGDVSWVVPTAQFRAATWVPGTPAHSWQAVAAGGTSIGIKGMIVAAKTLAMTAIDLFSDPKHIKNARAEFERQRGPGYRYRPLIEDRKPPLDYRK